MGSDNVNFSDWLFFSLTIMPWNINRHVSTVFSCFLLSVFHGTDVPQLLKQFNYYRTICLFPVWFVQSPSGVQLFATTRTAACQASLSFTRSQGLFKLMSIESVMLSNHLVLCRPFLLPWIFPSIRVFSNELALRIRWTKYWSFSFSISPSSEYSGLISFRIDWFDIFAVQGTLQFGAITKSCYEQSHTSFHVDMFRFFLGYSGVKMLEHTVSECKVFWETAKLSSRMAIPFHIPTSNLWERQFLCILTSIWYCHYFSFRF